MSPRDLLEFISQTLWPEEYVTIPYFLLGIQTYVPTFVRKTFYPQSHLLSPRTHVCQSFSLTAWPKDIDLCDLAQLLVIL